MLIFSEWPFVETDFLSALVSPDKNALFWLDEKWTVMTSLSSLSWLFRWQQQLLRSLTITPVYSFSLRRGIYVIQANLLRVSTKRRLWFIIYE